MKRLAKNLFDWKNKTRIAKSLNTAKEYSDTKAVEFIAQAVKELAVSKNFSPIQTFNLFYEINRTLYPEFVINDRGRVMLQDEEFRAYVERFAENNWTTFERKWNVREFLRTLSNVPGDFAECGVYKGANATLMCSVAQTSERQVHLFDSYEGLSAPGANDGAHWTKGDLTASEQIVHKNLEKFSCFKTFKGWIPDAFPLVEKHRYAFLHIDVDLEQPTYDSIAFFYPRMNKGGVVILDDHGYDTCPGARKAVLDFMADKPEPVLDLSTGQGLIIKS